MNAFEVTFIGIAWIFVTAGTVTPLQCYLQPTGRVMREVFGGSFTVCLEFAVGTVAIGSVMIGGWWVTRWLGTRVRTRLG